MITNEEHARRLELYKKGLSDGQIAAADCVSSDAIRLWRRKYELPANLPKGRPKKGGKP